MKPLISLTMLFLLSLAVVQCAPAAAPSPAGGVTASDIFARITTANGAVYMTLTNDSQNDDALVGAKTDVAKTVELHETKMDENDVMQMQPVTTIPIQAGGSVTLKPGGLHVMLIGIQKEMAPGDKFSLTLTFEKAGPLTVEAEVREGNVMMEPHMGSDQPEHDMGREGHQDHQHD